jgi:hypothetical protein
MKTHDDWARDGNISIIPAACLMFEAGVAIAAISIPLSRVAIIDLFLPCCPRLFKFFLSFLLIDTPLPDATQPV